MAAEANHKRDSDSCWQTWSTIYWRGIYHSNPGSASNSSASMIISWSRVSDPIVYLGALFWEYCQQARATPRPASPMKAASAPPASLYNWICSRGQPSLSLRPPQIVAEAQILVKQHVCKRYLDLETLTDLSGCLFAVVLCYGSPPSDVEALGEHLVTLGSWNTTMEGM